MLREEEQRELLPSHDQLQAVQVGAVQVLVEAVSTELSMRLSHSMVVPHPLLYPY